MSPIPQSAIRNPQLPRGHLPNHPLIPPRVPRHGLQPRGIGSAAEFHAAPARCPPASAPLRKLRFSSPNRVPIPPSFFPPLATNSGVPLTPRLPAQNPAPACSTCPQLGSRPRPCASSAPKSSASENFSCLSVAARHRRRSCAAKCSNPPPCVSVCSTMPPPPLRADSPKPSPNFIGMALLHRLPLPLLPMPFRSPFSAGRSSPGLKWLDELEAAGGRISLNATETGERSLSPPIDLADASVTPLDALVGACCDNMIDVFQRPNTRLYSWLKPRLQSRRVPALSSGITPPAISGAPRPRPCASHSACRS